MTKLDINFSKYNHPIPTSNGMTNIRMKELYIQFHTTRRKAIEALTDQRVEYLVADGRTNSPHTTREALFWAMEQKTEEVHFEDFAKLIVHECCNIVNTSTYGLADDEDAISVHWIKKTFGIEP